MMTNQGSRKLASERGGIVMTNKDDREIRVRLSIDRRARHYRHRKYTMPS